MKKIILILLCLLYTNTSEAKTLFHMTGRNLETYIIIDNVEQVIIKHRRCDVKNFNSLHVTTYNSIDSCKKLLKAWADFTVGKEPEEKVSNKKEIEMMHLDYSKEVDGLTK